MVGMEFMDFVSKLQVVSYVGVEDFADKLSFQFSCLFLLLATTIISVKQYLFKSISCYIPVHPSGADFKDYLENYCWVHGTIPFYNHENLPSGPKEWDVMDRDRRINYYQWVPFVLGLQCVLFYLPRVFWQIICHFRTGTDLEQVVCSASQASQKSGKDRAGAVENIALTLEDMFYQHRDCRHGKVADLRWKMYSACSFCVVSKRLGNWLVFAYLLIKLLYLSNTIGQIVLMQRFLGFKNGSVAFGLEVLTHISSGRDWNETLLFPRVAFCRVAEMRLVGTTNSYVAQCALPVNMLNEKIYIFLWFWTVLVASLTALSVPLWSYRILFIRNRAKFVKKFLRRAEQFSDDERDLLLHFISQFLRHDGVFLLRMLSLNAGDLITTDVVTKLWEIYKEKYQERDLRHDRKHFVDDMNTDSKAPPAAYV